MKTKQIFPLQRIQHAALDHRLNCEALRVYIRLIDRDHVDKATKERKGYSFPSLATLAKELRIHKQNVHRATKVLEALGYIERQKLPPSDKRKWNRNKYILLDPPPIPEDESSPTPSNRMRNERGKFVKAEDTQPSTTVINRITIVEPQNSPQQSSIGLLHLSSIGLPNNNHPDDQVVITGRTLTTKGNSSQSERLAACPPSVKGEDLKTTTGAKAKTVVVVDAAQSNTTKATKEVDGLYRPPSPSLSSSSSSSSSSGEVEGLREQFDTLFAEMYKRHRNLKVNDVEREPRRLVRWATLIKEHGYERLLQRFTAFDTTTNQWYTTADLRYSPSLFERYICHGVDERSSRSPLGYGVNPDGSVMTDNDRLAEADRRKHAGNHEYDHLTM